MTLDHAEVAVIQRISADLESRGLRFIGRPPGVNFAGVSADDLEKFGLPPRPDPTDEVAAKIWLALVSGTPPQKLTTKDDLLSALAALLQQFKYQLRNDGPFSAGRQQTSRNWSGALVAATGGRTFDQVFGTWTVPQVRLPMSAVRGVHYTCSTWIGIDGHRRTRGSLPQIGTTQRAYIDVNGQTQIEMGAWWQWWMRDHRNPVMPIAEVAVNAGDQIACSVTILTPTTARFLMTNVTTGASSNVPVIDAPFNPVDQNLGIQRPVPVRGSAAEWVVERPTIWDSTDLYPLPVIGVVPFTGCVAVSGSVTRGLRAARLIRMVERQRTADGALRSVVISRPRKVDTYSVSIGPPR